jgi:predicted GH43/DUF377 family glycosyl hydrolase
MNIKNLSAPGVPVEIRQFTMRDLPDDGVECLHPPIERLPEFMGHISASGLNPACRNFNGAICEYQGRFVMAYRSEAYSALNSVWMAELNSEFAPVACVKINIPADPGVNYEDPRLAVVGGRLHLIVAHVKFGIPNTCKQRLFVLGEDWQPIQEIEVNYGNSQNGNIEKNWLPFELPNGGLGLVYSQRPHLVIDVASSIGHQTQGVKAWGYGKSMNGRTTPLRISESYYLSFFGGHIKHDFRGARYFVGAQLFRAAAPFDVLFATRNPLAWGSEFSPTVLSARPGSGHPCCLFPAGSVQSGSDIIVSCGVNDSYIALLKYSIPELIAKMEPVNLRGEFQDGL